MLHSFVSLAHKFRIMFLLVFAFEEKKKHMPLKERQNFLKISFSDVILLIDYNHCVF